MEHFRRGGFVRDDTLTWEHSSGSARLYGEIACQGAIVIAVEKLLAAIEPAGDDDVTVQTVRYSYNVSVRGHDTIFRYDNLHCHPGHADAHHKHAFNWRQGREREGSPTWIGVSGWPTLGDVIEEAWNWYCEHRDSLPDPEGVAELGPPSYREV